jgi:hypothetical protein
MYIYSTSSIYSRHTSRCGAVAVGTTEHGKVTYVSNRDRKSVSGTKRKKKVKICL